MEIVLEIILDEIDEDEVMVIYNDELDENEVVDFLRQDIIDEIDEIVECECIL